jgi:hypothetical protein
MLGQYTVGKIIGITLFTIKGTVTREFVLYLLVRSCEGELKLAGFQIGSSCGDWNLDAKELYPIYKV